MPLTVNKKVDRKLLAEMNIDIQNKKIVQPRSEIEKIVLDAFKAVFNNENIGVYDRFSSLGGTSINGIRLVSELNKKGIDVKLEKLTNVLLDIFIDNLRMLEGTVFVEGKLPVPIIVFRAMNNEIKMDMNEWRKYTDKEFRSVDVPGTHGSLVKMPNVIKIIETLDEVFKEL